MEYATSCGVFSLILYIILIALIIIKLIKNRGGNNKVLVLIILSYLIQAFFNISVIAVAPLFWILLGYAVQQIYSNETNRMERTDTSINKGKYKGEFK